MIRLARPQDADFIRELARTSVLSSLPPTRRATPEQVQAYADDAYRDLAASLAADRRLLVLIAEHDGEPAGYVMIELDHVEPSSGERQAFIVDIAVRPEKQGRLTTRRLIRKASQLCRARGLHYLVCTISAHNEQALGLARCLEFEVERVQLVRRLR